MGVRSTTQSLDEFAAKCREAGLKATHQRVQILRQLTQMDGHPDAETLYRAVRNRIPTISLDTVYRTLRTLQGKGVVRRVGPPLDRGRFDVNFSPHHHFICTKCGSIIDFEHEEFDKLTVPEQVSRYGRAATVKVEVYGICNDCRDS